jgi:glycosyltransferase involved in cell wall biosynthesis
MPTTPFSIVCLSSQEWDDRLPTNRQQIMRRAASRGHAVLFVETGGFLGRHLSRLGRGPARRSILRRLFRGDRVADGIVVRKAVNVAPWGQRHKAAARLNARVTAAAIRPAVAGLPQPVVLWVYDPCAAEAAGRVGERFAVYDCVDDYPEQAGGDPRRRAVLSSGDAAAAARSRLVFATTRPLFERQSLRNSRTFLAPNGADYDRFSQAVDRTIAAPDVATLRQPVIGFAGNITAAKVDFDLLSRLAESRPDWTMLLVGPADRGGRPRVDQLARLPNVVWVGAKPYDELHRYIAAFDVGLIPYAENDYTRSCLPLKLYEYLAAGKPVVASGVPELAGMEPDVLLRVEAEEFAAAVEAVLPRSAPADVQRRCELASQNTWETRASRLLGLVGEELAR